MLVLATSAVFPLPAIHAPNIALLQIIIAVCGAAETLSDDIEMFLERIPAIDRCDGIAKDGALPDIHHVSSYRL